MCDNVALIQPMNPHKPIGANAVVQGCPDRTEHASSSRAAISRNPGLFRNFWQVAGVLQGLSEPAVHGSRSDVCE
jgi:hypothetical protein